MALRPSPLPPLRCPRHTGLLAVPDHVTHAPCRPCTGAFCTPTWSLPHLALPWTSALPYVRRSPLHVIFPGGPRHSPSTQSRHLMIQSFIVFTVFTPRFHGVFLYCHSSPGALRKGALCPASTSCAHGPDLVSGTWCVCSSYLRRECLGATGPALRRNTCYLNVKPPRLLPREPCGGAVWSESGFLQQESRGCLSQ